MRRTTLRSIVVIIFSVLVLFWPSHSRRPQDTSPQGILKQLADAYFQVEPDSKRGALIRMETAKVRAKITQDYPDQLMEAFAQIKTGPNGETYASNYLVHERRLAEHRKKGPSEMLPWTWRGPGNVSGRVRCVVVDASDTTHRTWFVASIGGGIWKTTDAGSNWSFQSPELAALSTTWLVQAPSAPNIFYAATGMGYGRVVELAGSGIWKSIDHGETWFQLESTAGGALLEAVNRIVVDPSNANVLLACTNDSFSHLGTKGGNRKSAIFKSTDGGLSWRVVFDSDATFGTQTDNRVQQLVHHPNNFSRLFATVNEVGVIRSNDAGETWQVVANNMALPADIGNPSGNGFGLAGISVRIEMAIAPTDPDRLYAAVERPRGIADLYMSRNGGDTWLLLPDTGNDPNWFNAFSQSGATGAYTAGWFDNTLAVHPFDPNVVFVGGVNLFRIDVNANNNTRRASQISNWLVSVGLPFVHADHHALVCVPINPASQQFWILDGNDGGVGFSQDGGLNWVQLTGMQTTQFYGVDKQPGSNSYIGGTQDNGTWLSGADPNPQSIWRHVIGGDGFEAVWNDANPNWLLGGSQSGGFARSLDAGQTWQSFSVPALGFQPFITKIASGSPDPDLVFAVGSNGIGRSDNFGMDWTLSTLPGGWIGYRPFDNVEISSIAPQVVWATSRRSIDPPSGLRGGIYVSEDSGLTFREVTSLPNTVDESSGVATHPLDRDTAYLLFSAPGAEKVLMTDDLGQSWQDLSGFAGNAGISSNGFPNVAVFSLLVMPHRPAELWAGTEIGLFVSTDSGTSWSYADNGLPHVAIFQLNIIEDQIVAATQGLGIWSVTIPELLEVQKPTAVINPRIAKLAMHPTGDVLLEIDLRDKYERTQVFVNSQLALDLAANSELEKRQLWLPVVQNGTFTVSLAAHKSGQIYKSAARSIAVFITEPVLQYSNNLDTDTQFTDFQAAGFQRSVPNGFSNGAAHTAHPYATGQDYVLWLKKPIQVQSGQTLIAYRDVVLVEPGTGSGVFGDPQFWDYVIVEASNNGIDWVPLADGYDSRANSNWLNAYNSGTSPDESMYQLHEIDINQTFMPGEVVFVRFRLYSDPAVAGWGWAIDQVSVNGSGQVPAPTRELIYPWVSSNQQFNSILVANNLSEREALVNLTARRASGDEVAIKRTIAPNGFLRESTTSLFEALGEGPGFTVSLASYEDLIYGNWVTQNLDAASGASPSQGVAVVRQDPDFVDQSLLLGYLPTVDGWTSAPVIVNLGDQPTAIALSFYNASGQLVLEDQAAVTQLSPLRPFAAVVSDLVDASENLSVIARGNQPLTGLTFTFNAGAEPAIGNATAFRDTRLLYPWISKNNQFESILVVNNPNAEEAIISLTARRSNGDSAMTQASVPAHGFLEASAGALFSELGDGLGFSVEVESNLELAGRWITYNLQTGTGQSPSQGVAVAIGPQSQARKRLLFPFLPTFGGMTSAPVVVQTDTASASVTLSFFSQEGALILKDQTTLSSLEPLRPFAAVVNSLLPASARDVYVIAESDAPLVGVAFVFNDYAEPAIGNAIPLE
ncbi:MAG: hypothetical protein KDC35_20920 [Acidobacteria bacterium]|nr:hypothetical protein [Acidobacteriota bacterium]